jgi:hypothetical protein
MADRVWQIASGAWGRNYADVFFDYDVMLMGPGDPGPFDDAAYAGLTTAGSHTKEYIASLTSFCRGPQAGDHVLVRNGHSVVGIGRIATNDYHHCKAFDDVYGWDLQHTRRVTWQPELREDLAAIQTDGPIFGGRRMIPTFTAVGDTKVLDRIAHLFSKVEPGALKSMPAEPGPELSLEDLGEALFTRGLSNDAVDKLLLAFRRQRRLTKWYQDGPRAGRAPSESEVVAHLVLPMLLALGWSEQLLAVEWQRIDLAAFYATPTTNETCVLVCEAKGPGSGLADDFEQAKGYVDRHGLARCRLLLLTEGTRFYLYARHADGGWPDKPTGYFNTGRIRLAHLLHAGTNPIDSILALSPGRLVRA